MLLWYKYTAFLFGHRETHFTIFTPQQTLLAWSNEEGWERWDM